MNIQEIKYILLNKNPKYNIETKYIRWYFRIIENAINENRKWYKSTQKKNPNYKYYERHHILPKAKGMFTEYKDFNVKYKWNKVLLTAKEHFICHLLIWKHYKSINYTGHEISMGKAIRRMQYGKGCEYTSKSYELFKLNLKMSKESRDKMSIVRKGLITVLNINTNRMYKVTVDEYRNNDNLISPIKGFVNCIDTLTNETIKIKCEVYHSDKDRYISMTKGKKASKETRELLSSIRQGKNNSNALLIYIYNEKGELMFITHGNFKQVCNENGLPYRALMKSYKNNGERVYQDKNAIVKAQNNGKIKYQGWYALIEGDKQINNGYKKEFKSFGKPHSDKDNGNSKMVAVYSNYSFFKITIGGFKNFCEENDLPYHSLMTSYKNNGKRLEFKYGKNNKKYLKYKGWFAIDVSKLKFRTDESQI